MYYYKVINHTQYIILFIYKEIGRKEQIYWHSKP